MWFWVKHIFLALILAGAAIFLILGDDWDLSFLHSQEKEFTGRVVKPPKKTVAEKAAEEDKEAFTLTTSKAAKGLSDFYGRVKEELLGTSKKMGDGFVLRLDPPVYSLDEALKMREAIVEPASPKFTGEYETRRFHSGDTLKQLLEAAAEKEGMELMWRLDRDYIVKHYFQVESNLLEAVDSVTNALSSDFSKPIYAFYCYRQRALLVTDEVTAFVKSNCRPAKEAAKKR